MASRRLEVEIVGDASSFKRALGQSEKQTSRFGGALKSMAKVGLLAGGAAGVGGLFAVVKTGIGEFKESQKVTAQTRATIKSMGAQSWTSAKQIEQLGSRIQGYSGVSDEAVRSGANLLLTFKNVRNEAGKGNDVFDKATALMTDMSVALGQDMKSSSIQLGKALNDPIKGVTALQRVGVSFTAAQKEQIAAMVESGNTMGAQKLILGELESQFGGSAKAAGETFGGQINLLKENFADFSGELVGKAMPTLIKLMTTIMEDVIPAVVSFVRELVERLGPAFTTIQEVAEAVWPVVQTVIGGVWAFVNDTVIPIVKALRDTAVKAWEKIAEVFEKHRAPLMRILKRVGATAEDLGAIIKFVATKVIIPIIKFAFTEVIPVALGVAITALDVVTAVFRGLIDFFKGEWVGAITGFFGEDGPVRGAFNSIKNWIRDNWKTAVVAIFGAIPLALWLGFKTAWEGKDGAFGKIKGGFEQLGEWLKGAFKDAIVKAFTAVVNAAIDLANDALGKLTPGPIPDFPKIPKVEIGDGVVSARQPGGLSPNVLDELGLAQSMGLVLTSGYRPGAITSTGNPSLHGIGKAIDVAGSAAQMAAFARAAAGQAGIRELIYTPVGAWYPGVGWTRPSGSVAADHYDHVHVGVFDKGGWLMPGLNLAMNNTGRPERVVGPGGDGDVHVHFHGGTFVGSDRRRLARDLVDDIQEELQLKRRIGPLGF